MQSPEPDFVTRTLRWLEAWHQRHHSHVFDSDLGLMYYRGNAFMRCQCGVIREFEDQTPLLTVYYP